MSRIQLESVSKTFGSTHVIRDVCLDIADGEFMVLLGPSGCGKSTLLRMVAGLAQPTSGRILLNNNDVTCAPPRQRDLAMVFQSYALYPHLTVAKNIGFPLRTHGQSRRSIAESVSKTAATLGLTHLLGRRPAELSGGQRQRVALGRAMVREPGAFLMDEPLSNLDAKLRSATRTELIELHRRLGTTFLYVTHDQVEAMTMAMRIALLNEGRIEQVGTPAELYDTPRSVFVAGFLGAPPMNLFDAKVVRRGGELHVDSPGFTAPLGIMSDSHVDRTVTVGIRPERIRLVSASGASTAKVVTVENLGSEELVHLSVGPNSLCARVTRPTSVQAGAHTTFIVDPSDIHLFDNDGRRLTWKDEERAPVVSGRAVSIPAFTS
ncbi:ABC transporter ATP-binding protein [Rhodococcus erythropolis]|uniref:Trehalose import ATP-binding protein SugC n=1 Tax=Rhodococcus erythropolis TaxID=1833 RepID=A0AAX3ZZM6_RHOER|nr:ABC transporter ATP-binding protein [Rhodococcus erythropolis]WMN01910.1 ABC transporter ATP-binding protein [Rhodococcus erythropolis]WMN03196.1 ABC transporter ATP-binding protein [Rhodococcus erythropolis]